MNVLSVAKENQQQNILYLVRTKYGKYWQLNENLRTLKLCYTYQFYYSLNGEFRTGYT